MYTGDPNLVFLVGSNQAPYQKKLIDVNHLVPEEVEWLNSYHSRCRDILAPHLNTSEMEWLKKATEPISA